MAKEIKYDVNAREMLKAGADIYGWYGQFLYG